MIAVNVKRCNTMLFTLCISAVCICQAVSYSSDDSSSDVKGSFGMLRLARGLQMLRLGKRLPDGVDGYSISEILHALMTHPRDDVRRQPPVPRYGRNLDGLEKSAKDLFLFPEAYRPAPRGGRYRRNNIDSIPQLYLNSQHEEPLSLRTVVRPRIGRYVDAISPLSSEQESNDLGSDNSIDTESRSENVLNL